MSISAIGALLAVTTDPAAAALLTAPLLLGGQYAAFLVLPKRWLWIAGYAVFLAGVSVLLNPAGFDPPQRLATVLVVGFGLWIIGRLYVETHDLATRDPLTGVYSRAVFQRFISEAIVSAHRRPQVLALADLDRLKEINDSAGHQAGDRALLNMVGSMIQLPDARIGRIGGDEFALLLNGVDEAEAARRLASARARSSVAWTYGLTALKVDDNSESALSRADAALYRGKTVRIDETERARD